jgi:hypothetical protein
MTTAWNDFNDAKQNSNLIPRGTIAKVRLTIRPGGFDDPSQGWTGGYSKRAATGAVYLDAEYTVMEGPFAKRKVWSMIGLYSPTGPNWGNMGRSMVRGILNSARGLSDKDVSPEAQNARRIAGLGDLNGLEFVARIDVGKDNNGDDKNDIRQAVTRDHREYEAVMGSTAPTLAYGGSSGPSYAPPQQTVHQLAQPEQQGYVAQAVTAPPSSVGVRPTWAK